MTVQSGKLLEIWRHAIDKARDLDELLHENMRRIPKGELVIRVTPEVYDLLMSQNSDLLNLKEMTYKGVVIEIDDTAIGGYDVDYVERS